MDLSNEEERGEWAEGEETLRRIAQEGARRALDVQRSRLFRSGLLAGFLGALVLMLPVSSVLYHDARANSRNLANANCRISALSRPQGNARAFVEREILEVAIDAFDQFPLRFRRQEDRAVAVAARREVPYAPGQGLSAVRSFAGLTDLVENLPLVSCKSALR